jgi:hypothetical protein
VWQNIATAAYDALNAVWIDRKGILKFRYFGNPIISLVALGGAADHSIPIDTLLTRVSMESVYNHVQAFRDSPLRDPVMVEAKTPSSIAEYGDLLLTRERLNPTADVFVQQLLLDRGASALQHEVGTIRPQTPDQFLQLISLGMSTLVQIRVSSKHGTPINEFASVLGGTIEANTDSGWSVRLATYQPGSQWQDEPKTVIRAYNTNKSLEIWTILGDATNYGQSNKAQGEIQASKRTATGDEKHDVMLDFPPLNWAGVTRIEKAVLRFHRPYHQDVEGGIEEGIYIKARRITAAWTENDKWPAPANTNLEEVAYYCDHTLGEWEEMDVTRIVRAWAPSHVEGGGSQVQYGIGLFTYYDQLGASYPPQHIIIDMKLSSTPAYLYLKLE